VATGIGRLVATVEKNSRFGGRKPCSHERIKGEPRRQFRVSLAVIPLSKHDPQAMGSAITYGRRYSLSAMLGIVTEEDDDGNMATYTAQPANYRQRNAQANPVRQESSSSKKLTVPVWNNLLTCMDELGLKDLIPCYKKYINGVYKHTIEKLTNEQY